ncbi:hypothetical protein GBA52_015614 [Prunus armeniaca]|nr:hypothetical protein GBA52_015614 [Prunus armeniaca]
MDADGNVRMYSRKQPGDTWVVTWEAVLQPCKIHGICGANSWCNYVPSFGRKCSCVPGYVIRNKNDWIYGCQPEFNLSHNNSIAARDQFDFMFIPRVEIYGFDFGIFKNYTWEKCKNFCLDLGNCTGFHFKYDTGGGGFYNCFPKMQLRNGYRSPGFVGDLYVKLPKSILSSYNVTEAEESNNICSDKLTRELDRIYQKGNTNQSVKFMLEFASGLGALEKRTLATWVREKMNEAFADAKSPIGDEYEKGELEILVKVALQCIEEDKDARPTMSQVVQMFLHHENNLL